MSLFTKKQITIEAIQWNGNSNKKEIETFVGRELKSEVESETAYIAGKGAPIFSLLIETKEGTMKAFRNDWIIKEPFPTGDRDFYPCKPDIFEKTYERLSSEVNVKKNCTIFKLEFDDRTDWFQAESILNLLQSYNKEYDDFDEIKEVTEISDEEAKTIMLKNTDHDEDDPNSIAEFSLFDAVVGDDFHIVGSTDWAD